MGNDRLTKATGPVSDARIDRDGTFSFRVQGQVDTAARVSASSANDRFYHTLIHMVLHGESSGRDLTVAVHGDGELVFAELDDQS